MIPSSFVFAMLLVTTHIASAQENQSKSAMEVLGDMYEGCLQDYSVSCVKPKALSWMSKVANEPVIRITEDLTVVKKEDADPIEEPRGLVKDVFDSFEDFLQTHDLLVKVPTILRKEGPLSDLLPRSFEPEDLQVPLAVTGRSKIVKKVIVPFLLGLKFKTAVLVPLALALIALKSWKALTLGLLSFVLTGALLIFKFTKPKVVNYEVVHYPHHVDHHVDHHLDHVEHNPGWEHSGYGRSADATPQDLAYNAYL